MFGEMSTVTVQPLKFGQPTLHWTYDYLLMLGLKLIHVSKGSASIQSWSSYWCHYCRCNHSISLQTEMWNHHRYPVPEYLMMTSSNGNIFRVTGLCAGNSSVPDNSPYKDQWRGTLMFSLIYAWIDGWVNNSKTGDLRRRRAHYDVTVMSWNNAV